MSDAGLTVITSALTGMLSAVGAGPYGPLDLPQVKTEDVLGSGPAAWSASVSGEGFENVQIASSSSSGLSLDRYPQNFLNAVLAAEDGRFRQHAGADPVGMISALIDTISGKMRGGSSLTQQLIKNAAVGNALTGERKMTELIMSVRLESSASKADIMEAYLRHAWFGRGVHGGARAAQAWFGKPWNELSLAESATLAGLLKGPAAFDPEKYPDRIKARRNAIISKMERYGWVTHQDAETARQSEVSVISQPVSVEINPWLMSAIRRGAEGRSVSPGKPGQEPVHSILHTTFSQDWQEIAENVVAKADLPPGAEVALIVLTIPEGDILATVGGRNAEKSGFDRTGALRQPGSLTKPLFYGAALDAGLTPWTLISNSPIDWGGGWNPSNYDGSITAPAPLYQGLEASSNLMTVHLADHVPIEVMFRTAEMSGAWPTGGIRNVGPSLLGATETTLRRATAGLAGIMNGGMTVPVRTFVEDAPPSTPFLSSASSSSVISMMRGVVRRGTASVANKSVNVPIVGKTGTSQNYRDAWFVGMTPHLAIGVWVGRDDDKSLGEGATGGIVSSNISMSVFNAALESGLITKEGLIPEKPLAAGTSWPPELIGDEADSLYIAGTSVLPAIIDETETEDDGLPTPYGEGERQVEAFLDQLNAY